MALSEPRQVNADELERDDWLLRIARSAPIPTFWRIRNVTAAVDYDPPRIAIQFEDGMFEILKPTDRVLALMEMIER